MRVYHKTAILLISRASGVTSEKTKAQEKVDSGGLEPPKPLSERCQNNIVFAICQLLKDGILNQPAGTVLAERRNLGRDLDGNK